MIKYILAIIVIALLVTAVKTDLINIQDKKLTFGNPIASMVSKPAGLTVTFPAADTKLEIGKTYTITWQSNNSASTSYQISVIPLNSKKKTNLGTAFESNKSFSWTF